MRTTTGRGVGTRQSILSTAAAIASAEGLGGLTIGRLAEELGMSKSGLFAHFGSKEELQLATVDAAAETYVEEVHRRAGQAEVGLARLWALCQAFLSHVERRVFPGGCFFAGAQAEFDARPGKVRDAIISCQRQWLATLERQVLEAQRQGQLDPKADAAQLAFELEALLIMGSSWYVVGDGDALERSRRAVLARLRSAARGPGRTTLPSA